MKYYEKQTKAQKNRILVGLRCLFLKPRSREVMVLKCLQCIIWCFEKCVAH